MKLSVIIVNYNVQYFLEQCLHSVRKALQGMEGEVFVVDNHSVDGSSAMVKEKFPEARLIENKENKGFSFANNQAIRECKGEYILLLNPDTLVEENTFRSVITFMDQHPEAGGTGVKMMDGSGNFLPESKRGLPTPGVAFFKISGLAALFPKSRAFGKYHLGYLDKEKIHSIEVLSGAFMMLRKTALDQTGLLDESFFMYGEDIDLSYRLLKAGYKNYYFPETRIIHYKGESTKKSSINYVIVFYNAMIIFAKKHFSKEHARTFSLLIHLAIYLKASFEILKRFAKKAMLPLLDAAALYGGMQVLKTFWEENIKSSGGIYYPAAYMIGAVPAYILIWLTAVFLSGGYDKPIRISKIVRGIITGTGIILIIYALLPESLRFSRALILLGSVWATLSIPLLRYILNFLNMKDYKLESRQKKKVAIVGDEEEGHRVLSLLNLSGVSIQFIGFVKPISNGNSSKRNSENFYLGSIDQLMDIAEVYGIDEIIFCAKDIPAQKIMDQMATIRREDIEYKIAPPESMYIIGSNSVNNPGDLYVIDLNAINKSINRRKKRMLDLAVSASLLFLLPVFLFLVNQPVGLLKNIFLVLTGRKSWVGYSAVHSPSLPAIRTGIFSPANLISNAPPDTGTAERLNNLYAKDYQVYNDLNIIFRNFHRLGEK